ncbi:tRNA (adenosine(37)-N6)-dimethylallyltransferase MiaA [Fulvivirga sedimenti]|uniref:tRNA dimethylallyltransferase n=1 Tax=Fulvivirga sedimenti TaxID=2879465 RepID=A0A9X1KYK6_9BACT|nr:tRNA (adenosine(37)-N6)-dimethylallyltransferase MiaA [Fulvivirga sedimenti]MCA6073711.1 tRNA (adenosine(37)-N6)-dimethylallyltransferase MiaA [Fulvivirga sedimenti]
MEGILIVIGGPTAIGKTDLSIELAEWLNTEIISADSRQCYREMTVGTAKPSEEELSRIPHHFINSHSITDLFTAGDFSRAARARLAALFQHHKVVITVGGSGLYLKAFLEGIPNIPNIDPAIREELNEEFNVDGLAPLKARLATLDPEFMKEADTHNPQRIIRALEVTLGTGKPFSSFRSDKGDPLPHRIVSIGLDADRKWLYERIDRRVTRMVENGLFDEAAALYPYRNHYALKTVGYQEIFDFIDGSLTREEAIQAIQQNSRRYAKRQLTWFRKYGNMTWFHPENKDEIHRYVTQMTGLT